MSTAALDSPLLAALSALAGAARGLAWGWLWRRGDEEGGRGAAEGAPAFDPEDAAWLRWERRRVAGARRGRPQDREALYRALAGPLYERVILPRVGEPDAAEDALAEAFRAAFERLDRFDDRGRGIWGWLATLGARAAMDVHRQRARTERAVATYERLMQPLEAGVDAPEETMLARRSREAVRARVEATMAGLNPRYRAAIELRFFEDRPREACADALGVRVGTFDVLLLRALRSFKAAWLGGPGADG